MNKLIVGLIVIALVVGGIFIATSTTTFSNPCSLKVVKSNVFSLTHHYTEEEKEIIAKKVIAEGKC